MKYATYVKKVNAIEQEYNPMMIADHEFQDVLKQHAYCTNDQRTIKSGSSSFFNMGALYKTIMSKNWNANIKTAAEIFDEKKFRIEPIIKKNFIDTPVICGMRVWKTKDYKEYCRKLNGLKKEFKNDIKLFKSMMTHVFNSLPLDGGVEFLPGMVDALTHISGLTWTGIKKNKKQYAIVSDMVMKFMYD